MYNASGTALKPWGIQAGHQCPSLLSFWKVLCVTLRASRSLLKTLDNILFLALFPPFWPAPSLLLPELTFQMQDNLYTGP